jgi:hypothetical protein
MRLKPGDIIEWVYYTHPYASEDVYSFVYGGNENLKNNRIVNQNEMIYSTIMKKCICVGSKAILLNVNYKNYQYSFVNNDGIFEAKFNDDVQSRGRYDRFLAVPRTFML